MRFVNRARLLPGGDGVLCEATAVGDDPRLLTPIDTPNRYNLYPPSLVLMTAASAGSAPVTFEQRGTESGAVALSARSRMQLQPGETRDIVLVIALVSPGAALAPVAQFAAALAPSATGTWFREDWAGVLAPLGTVPDPTLRAELLWDGHALLAMSTYAAYYGQTFIPQGMTYDYHLDLNAGPRDHLQHAMAAAYFAPGLARSALLYTLCTMTEEGGIKFTVSGNGQTADSSWTTSDQQLFLLYALGEYLRITRDWSLLDVETPYLPRERQVSGTVLQKLERAFIYLRDHVGTGPHGLVRLLNADWNDQIYAGVATGKDRNAAESQMNSAMVMAVMPPLIEQLNRYVGTRPSDHAAAVRRLTRDMQLYVDAVTGAMMRDMAGRTFARRAWLGSGRALGDDDMYLEPQSFLLMAPGFPVERKRMLLREMQRRLIDGETLGPRQRERPAADGRMQPGTSENGGFWYSLAGQAVAGVATFDRAAALTLLDRMTFRTFSRRHPHYWVGQWTAPDTLNADAVGDIAGLPRPMDDGLWCRMASYCAHAHAWPIYSYFRIRDAGAAGS
ncbi:GH36-type glycosyl hydrolase domain-containing protein [Sphingomonas sp.]|uniref:GH36-type glycosyl hydrolase domain-containing protein n=1 Tax=Sphingomonas sp. TaxID=28214 RepID=UPI003CC5C899